MYVNMCGSVLSLSFVWIESMDVHVSMARTLSPFPWYRVHHLSHALSGKHRCGNGAGRCIGNKYSHFQGVNPSLSLFIYMKKGGGVDSYSAEGPSARAMGSHYAELQSN